MAEKAPVAVVVDSAASLPVGMAPDPQLIMVPMQLVLEGRTYLDGRDLTPGEFYRMQRQAAAMPTTSAPSPAAFLEAFRQAAQVARSALCMTVTARVSSSYNCAVAGAQEAQEQLPGFRVEVLDTETAAGGEGLMALEAWRAARAGRDLDEVAAVARRLVPRIYLYAFVDTLYYLWRGGRVPRIAHAGAALLNIKPLLELARGDIRGVARPRTQQKAMERLLELMAERVAGQGSVHATVMHADALEGAQRLYQEVEARFPCQELFISEFSPVMGAHTGPGLLGVAFWCE